MPNENQRRQGKTGTWTFLLETKDVLGNPIVMATPNWSSNSWPFTKACWEAMPVVTEEKTNE